MGLKIKINFPINLKSIKNHLFCIYLKYRYMVVSQLKFMMGNIWNFCLIYLFRNLSPD